jgi:hypothetical protein
MRLFKLVLVYICIYITGTLDVLRVANDVLRVARVAIDLLHPRHGLGIH